MLELTPEDASTLAVVRVGDELIMYLGCFQGSTKVALGWNVHLKGGFDFYMGKWWREMLVAFVDDVRPVR